MIQDRLVHLLQKNYFIRKFYLSPKERKLKELSAFLCECLKKDGANVLKRLSDALCKNKVDYWIDFGTLLGYYREKDFIIHDNDIDIGAWINDAHKIRRVLQEAGFLLIEVYREVDGIGFEETYKYGHLSIDVFYYEKDEQFFYAYGFILKPRPFGSKKWKPAIVRRGKFPAFSLKEVIFKNIHVFIPDDSDTHLRIAYGDDYLTPNPSFDSRIRPHITEYSYEENPGIVYIYGHKG